MGRKPLPEKYRIVTRTIGLPKWLDDKLRNENINVSQLVTKLLKKYFDNFCRKT